MKLKCMFCEKRMKWLAKRSPLHVSIALWSILVILTIVSPGMAMISAPPSLARSLPAHLSLWSGPFDFGNQTIRLDHEVLHFTNGFYRSPDGQHTARLIDRKVNQSTTRSAAILIDNPAGSGIFYYVIGAARADGKERYSTPVFLGDRIKIETVSVSGDTAMIHYLDHPAHSPIGTPPTKPVTVTYTIQANGNLR
jgi:hypothetical protein